MSGDKTKSGEDTASTQAASESGGKAGSKPGGQTSGQTGSQSDGASGSQTDSQTDSKTGTHTAGNTGTNKGGQSGSKPSAKTAPETKSKGWKISRTEGRCRRCKTGLPPGATFYSYLDWEAGGEVPVFVRHDICAECWPLTLRELPPSPPPIYWHAHRKKGDKNKQIVDLQAMQALFYRLLEDERPDIAGLRYVIALMLQRKKLLKPVRRFDGARGDLFFRDPRDPEAKKVLRLPVPDLDEEALSRLRDQLGDILGTES